MKRNSLYHLFAALCCAALCTGAALAQSSGWSCPGNIVRNGGFNSNTVIQNDGSMPPSTTDAWTAAYGSPQLQGGAGCHDPDYVSFWGNQAVGEAIQQPVTLLAGHRYIIEFCARFHRDPDKQPKKVKIVVRGSTASLPDPGCPSGSCETFYTTPDISSPAWQTFTTCFVPIRNESVLTISPSNDSNVDDGAQVSFGQVDDICIHEASPPTIEGPKDTCNRQATYCVKPPATGPFQWTVNNGTFQNENSDGSCILVTWTHPAGSVSVTSHIGGCTFSSSVQVGECLRPPCCTDVKATLSNTEFTSAGTELTVTLSGPPATVVTATILGASHVVTGAGCGVNGPIAATASPTQPSPPTGWTGPTVPFLNGNQFVWQSIPTGGSALGQFTFDLQLPPLGGSKCRDEVTICIEFEVTYRTAQGCRTCKVVQCFKVGRCPDCP